MDVSLGRLGREHTSLIAEYLGVESFQNKEMGTGEVQSQRPHRTVRFELQAEAIWIETNPRHLVGHARGRGSTSKALPRRHRAVASQRDTTSSSATEAWQKTMAARPTTGGITKLFLLGPGNLMDP